LTPDIDYNGPQNLNQLLSDIRGC